MSRAKDINKKNLLRIKRKRRVRGNIDSGTTNRPRVSVFKSNKYLSAQAIDDITGNTVASVHSKTMGLNVCVENAIKIGEQFATNLKDAKIDTIVFDRNGYLYHGVVKQFAETLRENGIKV